MFLRDVPFVGLCDLAIGKAVSARYTQAFENGDGKKDFSVIQKLAIQPTLAK